MATAAPQGRSLARLKQDYLSYLDGKTEEISEQQEARRYYHGSQWTADQIKALNKRRQPVVTYNREARKINAIVGLLERQRQDPRAYPRTPKHEEGADIATAVVRYVLDEQRWTEKSPNAGLSGAVDGIGGIELLIEQGDTGDNEVGFDVVDTSGFFYDPRSVKPDFSDATFQGIGRWADESDLIAAFPDKEAEIRAAVDQGTELTSNPDSDGKWITGNSEKGSRRIRLVDEWYRVGKDWHYAIFTGASILAEGKGYFTDEKGRSSCKYIMFSAFVDHDGDRYGFHRNLKSSADEINQRRSKALWASATRRIIVRDGEGIDIEKTRAEANKPDGVIVVPPGAEMPQFDDAAKAQELTAQIGLLKEAKDEIENYGINPALIGQGVSQMSGRAMAMQQQAGIAELGPFILAYKGWKLRVYRAIWNAVRQFWSGERWIRVTDDEDLAKFIGVNQLGIDPSTGLPAIINKLGALDVDIIMDEGPDTINMQMDAYDTLTAMARGGGMVPPELLLELSPLQGSVKKRAMEALDKARQAQQAPPNPMQQAAIQLDLQAKNFGNQKTQAETAKIIAETQDIGASAQADRQSKMIDMASSAADAAHKERMATMAERGKMIDLAARAQQPQPLGM